MLGMGNTIQTNKFVDTVRINKIGANRPRRQSAPSNLHSQQGFGAGPTTGSINNAGQCNGPVVRRLASISLYTHSACCVVMPKHSASSAGDFLLFKCQSAISISL